MALFSISLTTERVFPHNPTRWFLEKEKIRILSHSSHLFYVQYAPDFPRLAINSGVSDGGDNVVPEFCTGFMLTAPVTNQADGVDEKRGSFRNKWRNNTELPRKKEDKKPYKTDICAVFTSPCFPQV